MRRTALAGLAVLAAVSVVGGSATAASKPPVGAGKLVQLCYDDLGQKINTSEYLVCRGFQAAVDSIASLCRLPARSVEQPAVEKDCDLIDGRPISAAAIKTFRHSSVYRRLMLQERLGYQASLLEEQIPSTHNSFNASSYAVPLQGGSVQYAPSLTNQDPNQVYSITDQLRMGIRGLEIDLHWVPSIYGNASTGGRWVDVCHGQSTAIPHSNQTVHVGCTVDRSLQNTLAEVRTWMRAHPHQFLLVYLENQLDGNLQAHNLAASLIRKAFGHLIYRPPAGLRRGRCASMPYRKSEAEMARGGHRVLLVGNCGPGDGWNHLVFTRGPRWDEGGNPTTYGAADCRADRAAHEKQTTFRRWYEESPFLEAAMDATQVLTPKATARMMRCGVNLIGFDQLMFGDGRLRAFVWSWAKGQPASSGRCVYQASDSHFHASPCARKHHVACVDAHLDWHVTKAVARPAKGQSACIREFPGSQFGVPPNGYRNWQLQHARSHPLERVWVDYAKVAGRWRVDRWR